MNAKQLNFHLPGYSADTQLRTDEPSLLYRQLVCWCLVQRFWYYVLSDPQVPDGNYDEVERHVAELEKRYGFASAYSPLAHVGTDNWKMFPHSVIGFFSLHPAFLAVISPLRSSNG